MVNEEDNTTGQEGEYHSTSTVEEDEEQIQQSEKDDETRSTPPSTNTMMSNSFHKRRKWTTTLHQPIMEEQEVKKKTPLDLTFANKGRERSRSMTSSEEKKFVAKENSIVYHLSKICSIAIILPVLFSVILLFTCGVQIVVFFWNSTNSISELSTVLQENMDSHITSQVLGNLQLIASQVESMNTAARYDFVNLTDLYTTSGILYDIAEANPTTAFVYFGNFDDMGLLYHRLINGTLMRYERTPKNTTGLIPYALNHTCECKEIRKDWGISPNRPISYGWAATARPWFQRAIEDKTLTWSDPYVFSTGEVGITCSKLVYRYDSTMELGVANIDLTVTTFSNFLKTIGLTDTGIAYIATRIDGYVIASSRTRSEIQTSLTKAKDEEFEILRNLHKALEAQMDPATIKNRTLLTLDIDQYGSHLVMVVPINPHPRIDWLMLTAIPRSQFYGSIERSLIIALILVVVVTLVGGLLTVILSTCVLRPLKSIGKQMEKVSKMKLEFKPKLHMFHEIRLIQSSFFRMVFALRSFKKYVPVAVISNVMDSLEVARLHLDTEELTVFFLDIVNFTSICETLKPNELTTVFGNAWEELTSVIESNHGVVDKYIGDAIMALFGVPEPVEHHPARTALAALECIEKLRIYDSYLVQHGYPSMKCRIGMHCGTALIGNFGSNTKLNYTALGSTVNIGARLEPLCKRYNVTNLITEYMYKKIKKSFICYFVDRVVLRGLNHPLNIYSILSLRPVLNVDLAMISPIVPVLTIEEYETYERLEKISIKLQRALTNNDKHESLNALAQYENIEFDNSVPFQHVENRIYNTVPFNGTVELED